MCLLLCVIYGTFLAPEPLSCLAALSGALELVAASQSTHINPAELHTLHPLRKCHTEALCIYIIWSELCNT